MTALDIFGFVALATHFLVVFLILLRLILGKPKTFDGARRRIVSEVARISP